MSNLTVIVPVYNTSIYLKKCIDSILTQIDDEDEILLINDGSTDDSEQIIKEYESKEPNMITYYKKENAGIADTRNLGILKAKGKYILFVDSDDYIREDLIKDLKNYMKKDIDIIKFKLDRVDENGQVLEKVDGPIFDIITGEQAFNLLAFSDVLLDSPCVYLFKKELFIENDFKFKVGTEHEDFGLIPHVLLKAKTVVSINNYGYCYLQSSNSITRNEDYEKTLKKFNDALLHYDNTQQFLEEVNLDDKTKKNVKTYYTNAIILKLKELEKEDLKLYIQKIKKRKMIKNIQVHNLKQLMKKIILVFDIKLYIKLK